MYKYVRNPHFFQFLFRNQGSRKRFIFDLDRTLWDYTVETSPNIRISDVRNYIHSDRPQMLKYIQDDGHILSIASRSKNKEKCLALLDRYYPGIDFKEKEIYHRPLGKRDHFKSILKGEGSDIFYYFDDELHILKDIKKIYPHCIPIHTPVGLHPYLFKNQK